MKLCLAAVVLLALVMTSSATMSPEMKKEVNKMMNGVMGDFEEMMEDKKKLAPEGEMSERTQQEIDFLTGLMMGMKGQEIEELDPPSFESYLNPQTRRKRGFFDRFRRFKPWVSFGVDVGKSFYQRFFKE